MRPSPHIEEVIADGLLVGELQVVKVRAVQIARERRNGRGWRVLMVAAQLQGPDTDVVGIWATGPLSGPIMDVDAVAREYSTWGSAAKGDSRMGAVNDVLAGYPEVEAVRRVITGA